MNFLLPCRFNTASVLIQPAYDVSQPSGYVFQYSFCSYSTVIIPLNCISCYVSIQLLFLFNIGVEHGTIHIHVFQYSFCSYSTHGNSTRILSTVRFQYSFCSYSTVRIINNIFYHIWFQYSFCSYSTFARSTN